jgi:hypothetical protein
MISTRTIAIFLFILLVQAAFSQNNGDQWLRVVTYEDSVVDLGRTSLVLEEGGIIRAAFKTTLIKDEAVPGKDDLKYRSRLDLIEFNSAEHLYRVFESSFIDTHGKVVMSAAANGTEDWKPIRGQSAGNSFAPQIS